MNEPMDQFAGRLRAIEDEISKLCIEHGFKVEEVTCALARMIGIAIRLNCVTAADRERCLVAMFDLTRQTMAEAGTRPTWMQ